jgi:hypothetical protein
MTDRDILESPVDLPNPTLPKGHPLRWTTICIATASLFLLATNAVSLRDWVDEQTPGPIQAKAAVLAASWQDLTDRVGLGKPRALLHREWKEAQATRFERSPAKPDQR